MDSRSFPRLEVNAESFAASVVKGRELWYADSIAKMTAIGLLEENDMWSSASEGYKGEILKVAFENFNIDMTGPGILSGYELWLGFDWFGASNGECSLLFIVSRMITKVGAFAPILSVRETRCCAHFALGLIGGHGNQPRSKPGFSNSSLRSVQREIMVLAKTPMALQRAAYAPGQEVNIELLLKNMTLGGFPPWGPNPMLKWRATLGDKVNTTACKRPFSLGCVLTRLVPCSRSSLRTRRRSPLARSGRAISGRLATQALLSRQWAPIHVSTLRQLLSLGSPGATRGRSASFRS
eukprot:SAG31_NODE_8371_length_1464_cov_1.275458_1_plen_294_part_10